MVDLVEREKKFALWQLCLLAFAAMCVQDILGTVMVIFEAKAGETSDSFSVLVYGVLAGVFDFGGWIAGLICTALALDSIIREGWRTKKSLSLIAVVSAANFFGTLAGVFIAWGIAKPT